MTVKYNYKCFSCEHNYLEQRAASDPQFFTICHACGVGAYEEISVEVIADAPELSPGEEIIDAIEEEPTE